MGWGYGGRLASDKGSITGWVLFLFLFIVSFVGV